MSGGWTREQIEEAFWQVVPKVRDFDRRDEAALVTCFYMMPTHAFPKIIPNILDALTFAVLSSLAGEKVVPYCTEVDVPDGYDEVREIVTELLPTSRDVLDHLKAWQLTKWTEARPYLAEKLEMYSHKDGETYVKARRLANSITLGDVYFKPLLASKEKAVRELAMQALAQKEIR
jgi:hypothetical protein